MLVSCFQMQQAEEAAFSRGVTAEALMEQAGIGIAGAVREMFPQAGSLVLYLGMGNNAGDALVAARELRRHGWQLHGRLAGGVDRMKPLPKRHLKSIEDEVRIITHPDEIDLVPGKPTVLLDGMLGIGAKGPLRGGMAELAAEMNALRVSVHAKTVAMDIPSGVNGDTGETYPGAVVADMTVTVAQVKSGLVADEAAGHVGRLAWVRLSELDDCAGDSQAALITPSRLRPMVPRRELAAHKGSAGRLVILAGSRGFLGAAALACTGALRSGAGLVTLLARKEHYELLAPMVPPEIMVKPVRSWAEALEMEADAFAVGPGLGFDHQDEVLRVVREATAPMVVDADALTMMAQDGLGMLASVRGSRLFTPHPGEMARLMDSLPDLQRTDRRQQVEALAGAFPGHSFLLKGNRTVIATEGEPTSFNSTGHPGMASGGMGDTLTGACGAWLAQGLSTHQSACLAAWTCGRAAELAAASGGLAEESVIASDVGNWLGQAIGCLKGGGY
jgi:NAD(P)H-hydrate epimerase